MNLKKATVEFDDQLIQHPCLVDMDNETWNGFINPYLNQIERDRMIAKQVEQYPDELEFVEELKSITSEKINGEDYYYFGGAYCWSYVEEEEIILVPYDKTKSIQLRIEKLIEENESLYSIIQTNEKEIKNLLKEKV
tara:strand:- start:1709 stop:2119 length:411 start_codon:yes stop_codon:yes gene_type:complete